MLTSIVDGAPFGREEVEQEGHEEEDPSRLQVS